MNAFQEAIALNAEIEQLRRERLERLKKRARCVICKATVGRCKSFQQKVRPINSATNS